MCCVCGGVVCVLHVHTASQNHWLQCTCSCTLKPGAMYTECTLQIYKLCGRYTDNCNVIILVSTLSVKFKSMYIVHPVFIPTICLSVTLSIHVRILYVSKILYKLLCCIHVIKLIKLKAIWNLLIIFNNNFNYLYTFCIAFEFNTKFNCRSETVHNSASDDNYVHYLPI